MFSRAANFTPMTDLPVEVSKAIQKAFIKVDEEGSEAAAVTGKFSLKILLSFAIQKKDNIFVYFF